MLVEDLHLKLGIQVDIPKRAPEYIINIIGKWEVTEHLQKQMKQFAFRAVQVVTGKSNKNQEEGLLKQDLLNFIEDCGLQTFIPMRVYKLSNRVVAAKSDKNSQKSTKTARMIVENTKNEKKQSNRIE
ncbi:Hypothetical_protein [Hexamita inflata]|uniref:Hypothetical_protein n=1 Tax=Hexamita inflata TaxID=28002 RepID=A0AA86RQB1_9EUKA|nr:Hypothetical protein HINF_LOCUS58315 [Hexamita inflata]